MLSWWMKEMKSSLTEKDPWSLVLLVGGLAALALLIGLGCWFVTFCCMPCKRKRRHVTWLLSQRLILLWTILLFIAFMTWQPGSREERILGYGCPGCGNESSAMCQLDRGGAIIQTFHAPSDDEPRDGCPLLYVPKTKNFNAECGGSNIVLGNKEVKAGNASSDDRSSEQALFPSETWIEKSGRNCSRKEGKKSVREKGADSCTTKPLDECKSTCEEDDSCDGIIHNNKTNQCDLIQRNLNLENCPTQTNVNSYKKAPAFVPLQVRAVKYSPRLVGKVGETLDIYDGTFTTIHDRDLAMIADVLKANTIRLDPWVNDRRHTSFLKLCKKHGLLIIPTFDLNYFFRSTKWRNEPYSNLRKVILKHFNEFLKNVPFDAPVLMWSINHAPYLNETISDGALSRMTPEFNVYIELIKALRRAHYRHEWDQSTLRQDTYLRPLAIPIKLDTQNHPDDVAWYMAMMEHKAKWPDESVTREHLETLRTAPSDTAKDTERKEASFKALQRASGFDAWILETMPQTTSKAARKTVESVVFFNDSKKNDRGFRVYPDCNSKACQPPPTKKAAILQYGFSAWVSEISPQGKIQEKEGGLDADRQQKLLKEVWEGVITQKYEPFNKDAEENRKKGQEWSLQQALTYTCVSGAIVDEWVDDWNRCSTMPGAADKPQGYVQNRGGVCDEVRPGHLVHVEWFGLNSQYSFMGTHCIEPRFMQKGENKGFSFELNSTASVETKKEYGYCRLVVPSHTSMFAVFFWCVCALCLNLHLCCLGGGSSMRDVDHPDDEDGGGFNWNSVMFPAGLVMLLAIGYFLYIIVFSPLFLRKYQMTLPVYWFWVCFLSVVYIAWLHREEIYWLFTWLLSFVRSQRNKGGEHEDKLASKEATAYPPWELKPTEKDSFSIRLTANRMQTGDKFRLNEDQVTANLDAHLQTMEQRLYEQLLAEFNAVYAIKKDAVPTSQQNEEFLQRCWDDAMDHIHARVLEGYLCWLQQSDDNKAVNTAAGLRYGTKTEGTPEKRIDPADRATCTLEELCIRYATTKSEQEIDEYWRMMKPEGLKACKLWREALLLRVIESLSEMGVHSPEFLAAFYHDVLQGKTPVCSTASWSEKIPYSDKYADGIAKALGRQVKGVDVCQTALGQELTYNELTALEGEELRRRFPIKIIKAESASSDNASFNIPYDVLHFPMAAIKKHTDPSRVGLNFDDINDKGYAARTSRIWLFNLIPCGKRRRIAASENNEDPQMDSDFESKTLQESSSLFVILDIISNFEAFFIIKAWVLLLACYAFLGEEKRNTGEVFFHWPSWVTFMIGNDINYGWTFYMLTKPKFNRLIFIQSACYYDAAVGCVVELVIFFHGYMQRRLSWMGRGQKWFLRRFLMIVVTGVGWYHLHKRAQLPPLDYSARDEDLLNREYNELEWQVITDLKDYAVSRLFVFWLVWSPLTSTGKISFLPGRPQKKDEKEYQWIHTAFTCLAILLLFVFYWIDWWRAALWLVGVAAIVLIVLKAVYSKIAEMASWIIWPLMFFMTFYLEVKYIVPLAAGFDLESFCENKSDRRIPLETLSNLLGSDIHMLSSDGIACLASLYLARFLVALTAVFDMYFVFYLGTSFIGYGAGEYRGLRDVLSTTHARIELKTASRGDHAGVKQDRDTWTHGEAMHKVFGDAWRMIWSRLVEALYEDCYITHEDANDMVKAASTVRWPHAEVERNYATPYEKFTKLKFVSTKRRTQGQSKAKTHRCISEFRVWEKGTREQEATTFPPPTFPDCHCEIKLSATEAELLFQEALQKKDEVLKLQDIPTGFEEENKTKLNDAKKAGMKMTSISYKTRDEDIATIATTSTTEDVVAGASTVILKDVSGISAGMLLTISGGRNSETKTIVSVSGDSCTLDGRLQYAYTKGASIAVKAKTHVLTDEKTNKSDEDELKRDLKHAVKVLRGTNSQLTVVFEKTDIKFEEVEVDLKEATGRAMKIHAVSFSTGKCHEGYDPVNWRVMGLTEKVDGVEPETWRQIVWQDADPEEAEKDLGSKSESGFENRGKKIEKWFLAELWRCSDESYGEEKNKPKPLLDLGKYGQECVERLAFFTRSLKELGHSKDEPIRSVEQLLECDIGRIPLLSQIIPVYSETVILSHKFLCESDEVNTNLGFMISQFPQDWRYFCLKHRDLLEKVLKQEARISDEDLQKEMYQACIDYADAEKAATVAMAEDGNKETIETLAKKAEELIMEIRMWASMRSQTVSRTVIGAIQYHEVLSHLPCIKEAKKDAHQSMENCVELVLAHQTYGSKKNGKEDDREDVVYLLQKYRNFPFFLVFDYADNDADAKMQNKVAEFMSRHREYTGRLYYASVRARYRKDQEFANFKGKEIPLYTAYDLKFLSREDLNQIYIDLEGDEAVRPKSRWELIKKLVELRKNKLGENPTVARVLKTEDRPEEERIEIIEVLPRQYPLRIGGKGLETQGKAGNQLGALRFSRGHYLQMMDANMGAFLGEAAKVPFILRKFQPLDGKSEEKPDKVTESRKTVKARIFGFRESIFTGSHGSVGNIMASAEWSFGTICQRFLHVLQMRMHYGHPDFIDGFWASNRGSLSKASAVINLSEDIFAGFNVNSRGETSKHTDFLSWEKGRESSFNSATQFFTKVSKGNVGVMRSRDLKLITENMNAIDCCSFYFASIGFYLNNVLIDFSVSVYVFFFLLLTLASKELEEIGSLNSMLASEWVLSLGVVAMAPRFFELILEHGPLGGIIKFLPSVGSCMLMFTFINKAIASGVAETMLTGEAVYIATGRPNANTHYSWRQTYFLFCKSHFYPALKVIGTYCLYQLLNAENDFSYLPMFVMLGSSIMWIIAPILFCPQPTFGTLVTDLVKFWDFVIDHPKETRDEHEPLEGGQKELLTAKEDEKYSTLYEFWLKDDLQHKKLSFEVGAMTFIFDVFKFALVFALFYSSLLDFMWHMWVLFAFNSFLVELWRFLKYNAFVQMVSLLLWVVAPFLLFPQEKYVNVAVTFLVLVLFLQLVGRFLRAVAWFTLRFLLSTLHLKPELSRPDIQWANLQDGKDKDEAKRLIRWYDDFVKWTYEVFLTYQLHFYAAMVILVFFMTTQFICVVLDFMYGLHSGYLLNTRLLSESCCHRRGGYIPRRTVAATMDVWKAFKQFLKRQQASDETTRG